VFPMFATGDDRWFLKDIDEDWIIVASHRGENYRCIFYHADLSENWEINLNEIAGVHPWLPRWELRFIDDEFALRHGILGNVVIKKLRNKEGKISALELIKKHSLWRNKEISIYPLW
jgi:hypothetical protein